MCRCICLLQELYEAYSLSCEAAIAAREAAAGSIGPSGLVTPQPPVAASAGGVKAGAGAGAGAGVSGTGISGTEVSGTEVGASATSRALDAPVRADSVSVAASRSVGSSGIKVGACYNVFDGEELLEASIRSIRGVVQYVCIVYQTGTWPPVLSGVYSGWGWGWGWGWAGVGGVGEGLARHVYVPLVVSRRPRPLHPVSNFGEKNPGLKGRLEDLMARGLVDDLVHYKPVTFSPSQKKDLVSPRTTGSDLGKDALCVCRSLRLRACARGS